MSLNVPTPELDKMDKVRPQSQPIGEFLDWLYAQGWQIAKYGETVYPDEPCPGPTYIDECVGGKVRPGTARERDCDKCGGTGRVSVPVEGWVTDRRSIEQLLADFFEIDLSKIEAERRALLEAIRTTDTKESP